LGADVDGSGWKWSGIGNFVFIKSLICAVFIFMKITQDFAKMEEKTSGWQLRWIFTLVNMLNKTKLLIQIRTQKLNALTVFNPLKPNGKYMYRLFEQEVTLHYLCMCFLWFSVQTVIISLNSVNQLIFVMVKCGVLFEVRTGFLNNI
jgi:hypothetical protein